MNGHLDVVELLLKKNAYVNVKDNESNTPLFYGNSIKKFYFYKKNLI